MTLDERERLLEHLAVDHARKPLVLALRRFDAEQRHVPLEYVLGLHDGIEGRYGAAAQHLRAWRGIAEPAKEADA